jgi:hypothetical protein
LAAHEDRALETGLALKDLVVQRGREGDGSFGRYGRWLLSAGMERRGGEQ